MELQIKQNSGPEDERYIRTVVTSNGINMVVTGLHSLFDLIHDATTIEVDVTFKRVAGGMNEFEVTLWSPIHNRCKSFFSVLLCLVFRTDFDILGSSGYCGSRLL